MATSYNITRRIPGSIGGIDVRIYADPTDQAAAMRLLRSIPDINTRAWKRASEIFGKKLERLVKHCMLVGQPPPGSGVSWPPLVKWSNRPDHPIYNLTGFYRRNIRMYFTKARAFVGIRQGLMASNNNLSLTAVARKLEYGGTVGGPRGEEHEIPPRPLWRPAYQAVGGNTRFKEILVKELRKELRKYKHKTRL